MQLKTFAVTALSAAIMVGCATTQQPAEPTATKVVAKKAAPKAKPKVISGASGAMLASTCEGCHGTDGISQGPATPSIAGMSEDYLIEAMEEFSMGIPSPPLWAVSLKAIRMKKLSLCRSTTQG